MVGNRSRPQQALLAGSLLWQMARTRRDCTVYHKRLDAVSCENVGRTLSSGPCRLVIRWWHFDSASCQPGKEVKCMNHDLGTCFTVQMSTTRSCTVRLCRQSREFLTTLFWRRCRNNLVRSSAIRNLAIPHHMLHAVRSALIANRGFVRASFESDRNSRTSHPYSFFLYEV